jgi:hypothetical protein
MHNKPLAGSLTTVQPMVEQAFCWPWVRSFIPNLLQAIAKEALFHSHASMPPFLRHTHTKHKINKVSITVVMLFYISRKYQVEASAFVLNVLSGLHVCARLPGCEETIVGYGLAGCAGLASLRACLTFVQAFTV